jgi:Ca-activated chloride channel homolog
MKAGVFAKGRPGEEAREMRWNRLVVAGLCLSLLYVAVSEASARSEEKAFDPNQGGLVLRGGDGDELPAPVLGTAIEVRITGIVARTRVTQVFQNPTDQEWLTGIYLFPLPEGAAVDSLRMVVGGRVLEGVVQEKEEARQTLARAASAECGCKASLLEQVRPGLFTLSVANIGPRETVEIDIQMQQVVRYEQGRFVLRFPARNPFALHVDLAPGFPLARLASPTHEVAVAKDAKRLRWAVDLAEGMAPSDGDFVLEWVPVAGREPRAVYFTEEVDGELYSLLMILPPDDAGAVADRLPRETIFVIDNSGSMMGPPLEQAKEALLLGLGRLQPGDWFNVMKFCSTTTPLFPDSVPATPAALEQARQFVRAIEADSGTEMLPALRLALASQSGQARTGLVRQVIFATDGQVQNEAEILAFVPAHVGDRRLFTVALGPAPNAAFLRRAAEVGRGSLTQIVSIQRVAEGMAELFARLEAPMLRDIQVTWSDPAAEAWPAQIPDLYMGEPLVVSARLREPGPVALSGQRQGGAWEDELPAAAEIRGAGLDKLWAGRKVQALLDTIQQGTTGEEREEVRRAVLELGLRHHLVTPFTSLVAVDVVRTAPAGVEPSPRMVPLNRARASEELAGELGATAETIIVAAESPLLDERRIYTGSTVSQIELEGIPAARDPWNVLQTAPGVLGDRINIDDNESGSWVVDGLVITDMAALSASPGYFDFDRFEEIQVDTGGADVTLETPGPRVKLIRPRGTNEWRGSGFALWTGGELSTDGGGDRLDSLRVADLEAGGPLVQDRLWIWAEAGRDEIDRRVLSVLGGQTEERVRDSGSFRLNAQLAHPTSVELAANRGKSEGSGVGAGPGRSPETTWDEDGRESGWSAEATHVAGSSFYLTGAWSGSGRSVLDLPRGDGDARIDAAGVARGGWFGLEEEQRTREARLSGSAFFNTASMSHEVAFGSGWRRQNETWSLIAPDRLGIAGELFDLPADTAEVSEAWRSGTADARLETRSLWVQDTLNAGRSTFVLGARLDGQDLGIPEVRPWTLTPRLGWNLALGADRQTLLKASLGRFASRLGSRAAWHLDPDAPAVLRSFSQPGEPLRPWYLEGPGAVDRELHPEITDEAVLGVERALWPEFVVGLSATWRQTRHLLEERLLVRDDLTGEVFTATASDWVPAGRLTGVLPDGTPYDVPVWDLRPGLARRDAHFPHPPARGADREVVSLRVELIGSAAMMRLPRRIG